NVLALHRLDTIAPHEVALQGQKPFGLETPRAKVEIENQTNRYSFEIGGPAPLTNNAYLRLQPSGEVILAEGNILQSVPRSTNDWRSKEILDLSSLTFDHLQVRVSQRFFEIAKNPTNHLWQIIKPIPARADQQRIAALLEKLREAQVTQFVTDAPGADLERYALQTPDLELALLQGTNRVFSAEFGGSPTNQPGQVYARLLGETNVVLAPREFVDYLKQPYKNFHDPRLVRFNAKGLDRIMVRSIESFALQRQENGQWIADEKKMLPVDPEMLSAFVSTVLSMQIVDISKEVPSDADLKAFGLITPLASYSFFERQTNTSGFLTNILFTDLSFGTNLVDKIYVRRSDETPVYLTPLASMLQLPRQAFELRDRRIWSFPATNLLKLTFSLGSATNSFARGPAGWSDDPIANAAREEAVFRLSQLQARSWVAKGKERLGPFAINESSLKLELEVSENGGSAKYRVHFGRSSLRHDIYAAVILPGDTEPMIMEFPGEVYNPLAQAFPLPKQ
ncbi:MAG TPA: DUF4340 domain-containing protein, partial [Verrucomicrobiae bacterium]|nr:DUF4340 domain-containing protein [Verrucomicrobiae bacterium]